jgi:hypothetical protein
LEFWLTQDKVKIQLPVIPSSYSIKAANNNTSIVVEDIGEINLLGRSKLSEISISSFFPAQKYHFCLTEPNQPYEYVKQIEVWRSSNKPIRLIITETDVNMQCSIEDFEHGEQDGTGDVHFTLSLKQYKVIQEKIL